MIERLINPIFRRIKKKRQGQDLRKMQWEVLKSNLALSYRTKLDKKYGLRKINSIEGYQKTIPVSCYESLQPYWEEEAKGVKGESLNVDIKHFASTTGTTGDQRFCLR